MTRSSLTSLLASLLLTTACGAVSTGGDDPGNDDIVGDLDAGVDADPSPPPGGSPIVLAAPTRTTGSGSLAELTVTDHAEMIALIKGTSTRSVIEQRFVTRTDEAVTLSLDLANPTGQYGRLLASDVVREANPHAEKVLCSTSTVDYFDPRCATQVPGPSGAPVTGPLASGTWSLAVIDEATSAAVGCVETGDKLTCVLPKKVGAAYRIVTSVTQVSDLWSNLALGEFSAQGRPFAGIYVAPEYQCWDWSTASGGRLFCEVRYDYSRWVGIDSATLTMDPITVEVEANGFVDAMPSAQVQWSSGDDDLPGTNF